MSSQPHKLEDFIRGKLEEKKFPYDPVYWETAQRQLAAMDARKRKIRAGIVLLFLLGGVTLTLLGLWRGERGETEMCIQAAHMEAPLSSDISAMKQESPNGLHRTHSQRKPGEKVAFATAIPEAPLVLQGSESSVIAGQNNSLLPLAEDLLLEPEQHFKQEVPSVRPAISPIQLGEGLFEIDTSPILDLRKQAVSLAHAKRKWSLLLQGGAVGYREFSREGSTPQTKLSFLIGVQARIPLSRHWDFSAGLQYFSRNGINRETSTRALIYDFQATETVTRFLASEMHFLSLPVDFGYRFGKRHRLFAGAGLLYLLNVKGTLSAETSATQGDKTLQEQSTWGYTQGFRTWDYDLHLGYSYRLASRWELGLSAHLGLRDLTDDSIFKHTTIDRNHRLSIFLGFNLK